MAEPTRQDLFHVKQTRRLYPLFRLAEAQQSSNVLFLATLSRNSLSLETGKTIGKTEEKTGHECGGYSESRGAGRPPGCPGGGTPVPGRARGNGRDNANRR